MGRKADSPERPKVVTPTAADNRPPLRKIGLLAAGGLVVGLAWPQLAGIHIGPEVPGAKPGERGADEAAAEAPGSPAPSAVVASSGEPAAASAPATTGKPAGEQSIVVEGGRIVRCHHGKDRLESEACGALRVDRLLVPRLEQLVGCPSALGLAGELELGFDIDFVKPRIDVRRGKKSELPSSTVNGILACAADYVRDLEADKIPHAHDRYELRYTLKFYPPGSPPPREGADTADVAADEARKDLASVTWDTALVRDEPSTGKVVARLARGTRVPVLGRRKDWYRVKIGDREGWVYRGALGL